MSRQRAGVGDSPGSLADLGPRGDRPGHLTLVPTPIGNLDDITLRALKVLKQVDWIAAEDTRRARILLSAFDIDRPVFSHHAHNEHHDVPRLLERMLRGERGALITDAGMPGISDPGFLLMRAARRAGIGVDVLPGASAVTTALLLSGFPPEPFLFSGYVPATSGRRETFLREVAQEERTVVVFETPHRLRACLEVAQAACPDRPIAICREMTKLHEEITVGLAAELLAGLPETVKGEIALVFAPRDRHGEWTR